MTLGMAQIVDLKIVIDIFCLHYNPFSNLQAFNEVFFKTPTFIAMLWRKKKKKRDVRKHTCSAIVGEKPASESGEGVWSQVTGYSGKCRETFME